ncbi:MAG: polysaccharide pyruvyl transferase family protein [Candidatus Binatia bacterium]
MGRRVMISPDLPLHSIFQKISFPALIAALRKKVNDVVGEIVPAGSVCALLDFPNHANVGDSAIWLGEKKFLKSIGAKIAYECDVVTYSQQVLAERVGNGVILLHGGGNFGDVWPTRQLFREKVIKAFPENKIVLFPQTIYFKERSNLMRAQEILNRHHNLVILARDKRSLEFARNEFKAPSALCPDMAFMLESLRRPIDPEEEILWLARTDVESRGAISSLNGAYVRMTDWLEEQSTITDQVNRRLAKPITRHPRVFGRLSPLISVLLDRLAWQRVARGTKLLSSSRVVITDRLHGHILSVLLGIPHVVLDNNYGKLRDFVQTWTKACDLAFWADSTVEALERAQFLAQDEQRAFALHDGA